MPRNNIFLYQEQGAYKVVIDNLLLHADLFYFKRKISQHHEGRDHLEKNLIDVMPNVVTSLNFYSQVGTAAPVR